MGTKEQSSGSGQRDTSGNDDARDPAGTGTFETDISETGEDGTTVRQAEVSEKDLAEVKRSSNGGGRKDADDGSEPGA